MQHTSHHVRFSITGPQTMHDPSSNLNAFVSCLCSFITKKDRKLCSPPVDDPNFPWVRNRIEYLNGQRKKGIHNLTQFK